MRALFVAAEHASRDQRLKCVEFIDHLARNGFGNKPNATNWAWSLGAILHQHETANHLLSLSTLRLAKAFLSQVATSGYTDQSKRLLLATEVVRHFKDIGSCDLLASILERTRTAARQISEKDAPLIAQCLADLNPSTLLQISPECPGVQCTLKTRSLQQGWLIFADRILDGDGNELGACARPLEALPTANDLATPDLKSVLDELSDGRRRVLESYWLMVKEGGPCYTNDTYSSIHEMAVAHYEAAHDSDIGRVLENRFPGGFPSWSAWSKQLNHIERTFEAKPAARAFLESLGLIRRK